MTCPLCAQTFSDQHFKLAHPDNLLFNGKMYRKVRCSTCKGKNNPLSPCERCVAGKIWSVYGRPVSLRA